MTGKILAVILLLTASVPAAAGEAADGYKLYLIRHAEKQSDGSKDPALTEQGKARAQKLSAWLSSRNIEDIWSSDYKRTRETAKPLAESLGKTVHKYDPRKLEQFSDTLLQDQHTALIVGHSNTTPELAQLLCNCVIESMEETEYDRLIVVTIVDGNASVETLQQSVLH